MQIFLLLALGSGSAGPLLNQLGTKVVGCLLQRGLLSCRVAVSPLGAVCESYVTSILVIYTKSPHTCNICTYLQYL